MLCFVDTRSKHFGLYEASDEKRKAKKLKAESLGVRVSADQLQHTAAQLILELKAKSGKQKAQACKLRRDCVAGDGSLSWLLPNRAGAESSILRLNFEPRTSNSKQETQKLINI